MSARTVSVGRNRDGSWEITLPAKHEPISYLTLDEARLEAYRLAAHWHPYEIVMCDAYHRVVHRKLIDTREDAAVYPDHYSYAISCCADDRQPHRDSGQPHELRNARGSRAGRARLRGLPATLRACLRRLSPLAARRQRVSGRRRTGVADACRGSRVEIPKDGVPPGTEVPGEARTGPLLGLPSPRAK